MRIERFVGQVALLVGLAALVLTLTACGGGAGGLASASDGGISGTGNSVGAVTGFGSVFVNGTEFNTAGATIVIDGAGATQSDLRVGQVVVVDANFDDDKATRIEYRAWIKGPVQAVTVQDAALGNATLTVFGQSVATNSATNFSHVQLDPTAANLLKVGDLVEVSGLLDANGVLVASFLEAKALLPEFAVIGRVGSLTATTFRIGGLTVDFSSTNASPQVGVTVEVKGLAGDFNAGTNRFTAGSVENLAGLGMSAGKSLEIEGYITRFVGAADFDVNGVRVLTDAATTFEGGTAASLGLNVKVEAEGKVNSNNVLVAGEIKVESTGAIRIEGNVEQIDSANQRLIVLGATFSIRPETDLQDKSNADTDPFTFSDINIGDRIEMRGFLDGVVVVASQLERRDVRPEARLRGRVTAKNAAASQVDILGVAVTGNGATQYQGAGNQAAFFSAVQVGDFVGADWNNFASTNAPADELSLEAD